MGDGSDKLVTVGANPARADYGKVVSVASVGGRHEAHHGGFTDDRRYLWLGGLDSSQIFVFDVSQDPSRPVLSRRIEDFVETTGGVIGPHTFYALPGRVLISGLSNSKDNGGATALADRAMASTMACSLMACSLAKPTVQKQGVRLSLPDAVPGLHLTLANGYT